MVLLLESDEFGILVAWVSTSRHHLRLLKLIGSPVHDPLWLLGSHVSQVCISVYH